MKNLNLEGLVFGLAFILMIAKMFAGYPVQYQIYMQIGFYWLIAIGLILGAIRQTENWRKYTLFFCSAILIISVLQISSIPPILYSSALLVGVISNKRNIKIE